MFGVLHTHTRARVRAVRMIFAGDHARSFDVIISILDRSITTSNGKTAGDGENRGKSRQKSLNRVVLVSLADAAHKADCWCKSGWEDLRGHVGADDEEEEEEVFNFHSLRLTSSNKMTQHAGLVMI